MHTDILITSTQSYNKQGLHSSTCMQVLPVIEPDHWEFLSIRAQEELNEGDERRAQDDIS
ncbi:hypothetical protein TCA2_1774 [Paenibacillus sp. TCA20]|nr:hypothetical protein TCA2_1774 [Paenibacillus sp. TCA20]